MTKKIAKKKAPAKAGESRVQRPIRVGESVHIRTVTWYAIGRVAEVGRDYVLLSPATMVAWPNERFGEILRTGKVSDVEPFPDPLEINRGSIVDVTAWRHPIPGHP